MQTVLSIKDKKILYLLFFVIVFEGAYLPLLYAFTHSVALTKLLLISKYFLVVIYFAIFLYRRSFSHNSFLKIDFVFLLTIGYFLFLLTLNSLFSSEFSLSEVLLYLFPMLLYMAGRTISLQSVDLDKYLKFIVYFGIFIFAYALVDVLFFSELFWKSIAKQGQYLIDVKDFNRGIVDDLIGNFYFNPWSENRIRRAVGFAGDPLAFAYSSVFVYLAIVFWGRSFFKSRTFYYIIFIIGSLALILTLTRAILISLIIVVALNFFFKRNTPYATFITGIIGLILILNAGFLLTTLLGLNDGSTRGHLDSITSVNEFTWADVLMGHLLINPTTLFRFESGFLGVVVNFGILGSSLLFGSILYILRKLYDREDKYLYLVSMTGSIGLLSTIVFSESFFSFTGYGFFWLNLGIAMTINHSRRIQQMT